MSIQLKILKRTHPRNVEESNYYAAAVARGEINLEQLAKLASMQSTVTPSDCYAVLMALEHNVIEALQDGKIVRLGGLGSYKIGVNSEGLKDPKKVTRFSVKKAHILFNPGKGLKDMLKNLDFKF